MPAMKEETKERSNFNRKKSEIVEALSTDTDCNLDISSCQSKVLDICIETERCQQLLHSR